MPDIELARNRLIQYLNDAEQTELAIVGYRAKYAGELDAAQAEFTDYRNHPAWLQLAALENAQGAIEDDYSNWGSGARHKLGWEGDVIFSGNHRENKAGSSIYSKNSNLNPGDPNFSVLPLSLAEFDRRVDLAGRIGQAATLLAEHDGEPIVKIALRKVQMPFATTDKGRAKIDDKEGRDYRDGRVDGVSKIDIAVGRIAQTDKIPYIKYGYEFQSRNLCLVMAGSVAGSVANYHLPYGNKKQLKGNVTLPTYKERYSYGRKNLPLGTSKLGNFTVEQLMAADMLVVQGPLTTGNLDLPPTTLLVKQKRQLSDQTSSLQQTVVINSGRHEQLGETWIKSTEGEVTLPNLGVGTAWLVGRQAIKEYLLAAICDITSTVGGLRTKPKLVEELVWQTINTIKEPEVDLAKPQPPKR